MKAEKTLSLIMAVIMPFPFIIAGFVSVYEAADWRCLCFGTVFGVTSWLLGYLFGSFMKKGKKALYLIRLGLIISCAILVIIGEIVLTVFEIGSLAVIFSPFGLIMWCWFGQRLGSEQELIPYAALGTYCVEAALMYPFCISFEENNKIGSTAILIITAFLTVAGALLINKRQLGRLFVKGEDGGRGVSRASLKFNVRTTLIFCGIILFLFLFAGYGAKWLWEGIKKLIQFIIWLLQINPDNSGAGYIGDLNMEPPINLEQGNPLIWYIIISIIAALAIFLIIKLKTYEKLLEYYKKLLGRKIIKEETDEYTDLYQDTTIKTVKSSKYKRLVKAFKKEKDTTKKFRLGYKAFMLRIGEKTEKNNPSDTTRIHLEKGKQITDFENLEQVVNSYCQIRYGERSANGDDCRIMEALIISL